MWVSSISQTLALAVHEHGEEPVAEVGEFLVLGAVAFDEIEEGGGDFVELLDEISGWDGDGLGGDDFGVHCGVGGTTGYGGEAVCVGFRGEGEEVEFPIDRGLGLRTAKPVLVFSAFGTMAKTQLPGRTIPMVVSTAFQHASFKLTLRLNTSCLSRLGDL